MLTHKTFKFRFYPTPAQEARLRQWENALRFLWNIAHEQRLMGLARTDKRYPTTFAQINELTGLRADLKWLSDVPRNVCAQLLVDLDRAWQRCFKRLSGKPHWKKRSDLVLIQEPHPATWRCLGNNIRFPKIGTMRTVMHRPIEGKRKSLTLKREGDQWFAIIVCEIELNPEPRTAPVVALDRGITNFLASSDGELTPNPRNLERSLAKLARAQRIVARRKKGSKNRAKAKNRVMRIHRKVKRQREHFLHVESSRIAKSHGVVVIENLNVAGMIRSNLGRSIADVGWSAFANMLRYKLEWSGGQLVEVPAAYSSQTCSACGAVDAASRKGERFCCADCGFVDHADLNAAKVLKARANRSCLPVDGSLPEGPGRNRKPKVSLRVPRRPLLGSPAFQAGS